MKRFAVIGDPVDHSLSPALHRSAFRTLGLPAEYTAIRVQRDEVAQALRRLADEGFAGVNVTTPLKELVLELVTEATTECATAGGVNTVRFAHGTLQGHNTDGIGCVDALRDVWNLDVRGKHVLLLGSGPAARAIAAALRPAGTAAVWCWSRNDDTARRVGEPPTGTAELVISALPASADVPDEVLAHIGADADVMDLNYRARRSPVPPGFGARRTDGLSMLLHQGARSFEWWWDQAPPLEAMREALDASP